MPAYQTIGAGDNSCHIFSVLACCSLTALGLMLLSHHQGSTISSVYHPVTMRGPAVKHLAGHKLPHIAAHHSHRALDLKAFNEVGHIIDQPAAPGPHAGSRFHPWPPLILSAICGLMTGWLLGAVAKRPSADEPSPPAAHPGAGLALAIALTASQSLLPANVALAALPTANVITDPQVLLANSLPTDNKVIYKMEQQLQGITEVPESGGAMRSVVSDVITTLADDNVQAGIVSSFAAEKKDQGIAAIDAFQGSLLDLRKAVDSGDKPSILAAQKKSLKLAGDIQAAMVKGFPFEVPAKYASLPQLKGRATVECKIKFNDNVNIKEGTLTIVVDGYNAPVTAGNFIDLVNKKFYDGMEIQRADGFVVQTGDPKGEADGYVDPKTKKVRVIPFEVKVTDTAEPYYEATLEDLGIYNAPVALPFNAFGTMAMARDDISANSGSSQFFWLLKDAELTPIGNNVLDGRYAAFGYVTNNEDLLKEVKVGDQIVQMKVLSGMDKLEPGDANAPPVTFDF